MIVLADRLRNELSLMGAAMLGFADLGSLPAEQRGGMDYGISIAVVMNPAVVNALGNGHTREHDDEYHRLYQLLDSLDLKAAEILHEAGFEAWPLTRANVSINQPGLSTDLPYKTVATMAGLGWIGKCAMLVTEAYGSAFRVSAVLTNAPLPVEEPITESRCGNCNICVNNCPGEAASGQSWTADMAREDYFDAYRCHKTCIERSWRVAPGELFCSLCILVCPWTRKYILSSQKEYGFPPIDIAGPGDLEEILALQQMAFQSEAVIYDDYNLPPLLQSINELRTEARDSIILKASADRRIVGSVRAYRQGDTCYMGRLIVHPDYQNQGIGQRLLQAIEGCFSGLRLELFTGSLSQKNLALYEKMGYRRFKTEQIKDSQQMIYMEKMF